MRHLCNSEEIRSPSCGLLCKQPQLHLWAQKGLRESFLSSNTNRNGKQFQSLHKAFFLERMRKRLFSLYFYLHGIFLQKNHRDWKRSADSWIAPPARKWGGKKLQNKVDEQTQQWRSCQASLGKCYLAEHTNCSSKMLTLELHKAHHISTSQTNLTPQKPQRICRDPCSELPMSWD